MEKTTKMDVEQNINPGMATADGRGLLRGQTNWYMMYLQSLGLIPRSIWESISKSTECPKLTLKKKKNTNECKVKDHGLLILTAWELVITQSLKIM